jgi:hypothetical protein
LWRVNLAAKKKSATNPQPAGTGGKPVAGTGAKPVEKAEPAANATGTKTAGAKATSGPPPVNGAAATGGKTAGEKTDSTAPQFSSLVSKVLELADAGVGLGINVVSLLTNFAKTQAGAGAAVPTQQAAPAAEAQPAPSAATDPSAARNYCIVNRLPLHPGDSVKVSFSINNDMPDSVKNLALSCRGFVGAAQAFAIADKVFSIEPASAGIGPMDFERFVLKGAIPANAPADSYNGWILVAGDEQMRIPAVLMVT